MHATTFCCIILFYYYCKWTLTRGNIQKLMMELPEICKHGQLTLRTVASLL